MEQSSYLGSESTTTFTPTSEERIMAILAHVLTIFFPIIAPLIIYLIKKDESAYVADHAKESLNFQISMALICIGLVITLIGILLLWVVGIFVLVCVLLATIKAADNKLYKYPLTWRLIK